MNVALSIKEELFESIKNPNLDIFPYVLIRQYTKESFLYKDLNRLLRNAEDNCTHQQFAKEFEHLFPYYFFFSLALEYVKEITLKLGMTDF